MPKIAAVHGAWSGVVKSRGVEKALEIEAFWWEADPLVVSMTFSEDDWSADWDISRDVLLDAQKGILSPSGADVRAHFGSKALSLFLSGVGAPPCTVVMDREPVNAFLRNTLKVCPQGEEFIDVDAALEELLK